MFVLFSPVGCDEFSWLVRYGAVSALVQLVLRLRSRDVRNGVYRAAWGMLQSVRATEMDRRVMMAFRVGQVRYACLLTFAAVFFLLCL